MPRRKRTGTAWRRRAAAGTYALAVTVSAVVALVVFAAVRAAGADAYGVDAEVVRTTERADGTHLAFVRWTSPNGGRHTRNVLVAPTVAAGTNVPLLVEPRPDLPPAVTVVDKLPDWRDDVPLALAVAFVGAAFGLATAATFRGMGLLPDLDRPGSSRPVAESRGFYWRS